MISLIFLVGLLAGSTPGHLVLIGGGKRPDPLVHRMIELAGGKETRWVVIPTASELQDTGSFYINWFAEYGCQNTTSAEIRTLEEANAPANLAILEQAEAFYFAGGDQRRITKAFLQSEALRIIRSKWENGALIAGTSAGTACMSELMITGDGEFDRITSNNIVLTEGLGFVNWAILDQHFVARKRQNRLLSVVLENPTLIGLGIDEATAAWFKPDGSMEVLGEGWIWVYDARKSFISKQPGTLGEHIAADRIQVHLLAPGMNFRP